MLSPELTNLIKKRKLISIAIWAAITLGLFMFCFAGYIASNFRNSPSLFATDVMSYLTLAALILTGLFVWFRSFLTSEARIKLVLSKEINWPSYEREVQARRMSQSDFDTLKQLPPNELKLYQLLDLQFFWTLLFLCLHEIIGLIGLVGVIGFQQPFYAMLPFVALAILLNISIFPRPEELLEEWRKKLLM